MPKLNQDLLAEATLKTVGLMSYAQTISLPQIKKARRLSGITKGQWKRMVCSFKRNYWSRFDVAVSALSIKKLEIMRDHGGSEHLETLLKMVEAQMEAGDGQS